MKREVKLCGLPIASGPPSKRIAALLPYTHDAIFTLSREQNNHSSKEFTTPMPSDVLHVRPVSTSIPFLCSPPTPAPHLSPVFFGYGTTSAAPVATALDGHAVMTRMASCPCQAYARMHHATCTNGKSQLSARGRNTQRVQCRAELCHLRNWHQPPQFRPTRAWERA